MQNIKKAHLSPIQKRSFINNALITVAATSSALAISALFIPQPKSQLQAQNDLDITSSHLVCNYISQPSQCDHLAIALGNRRQALLSPGDPIRPYKPLANCREAVDYIFTDRVDYDRAIRVVYRESTNNPIARRPGSQYVGCAQLSTTLQATFLRGTWNDPYYNVLALRDAVDSPRWGWCHWDLVNYCDAGGEF